MTSHVLEVWTNIMKEVLPYLGIYSEVQYVQENAEPEDPEGSVFEQEQIDQMNQDMENSENNNQSGEENNGDDQLENSEPENNQ